MKTESGPMLPFNQRFTQPAGRAGRASQRGQLLVVFALALTALIGMVGLIIDGGDTFLQRRDEQNVADAAAMAAGYASVNGQDPTTAAQSVAASNGYVNGVNSTTVTVASGVGSVTVTVSRPHRNYFSGVVGFASWGVSATATAQAGTPNGAYGAMPLIFNQKVFQNPANSIPGSPATFDEPPSGNGSVPQDGSHFNWTVFGTANGNNDNLNSKLADDYINANGNPTTVYPLIDNISPLNAGSHTTLYSDLAARVGNTYPVAIVDDTGTFVGWANFHITGSQGSNLKQISGWLDKTYNSDKMVITAGKGNAASFVTFVKLIN
ncbi:MAG: hypothetical protein HY264_08940 [Chloroflexi bacterium]|nr:hypothetical protein [Chloroflexota bacterium]